MPWFLCEARLIAKNKPVITLPKADLTRADLHTADLSGANLTGANFSEAHLKAPERRGGTNSLIPAGIFLLGQLSSRGCSRPEGRPRPFAGPGRSPAPATVRGGGDYNKILKYYKFLFCQRAIQ